MFVSGKKGKVWKRKSSHFCQRIKTDFSCQNSSQLLGFYLQGACQLPPGCSALRHHRMPERPHPPEGNQPAAGPDPRPGDPPEPGHEPEEKQIKEHFTASGLTNQMDGTLLNSILQMGKKQAKSAHFLTLICPTVSSPVTSRV